MSNGVEEYRRRLRERLRRNREAFEGAYKDQLDGLSGLSREEVDRITPNDVTDLETYNELIEIVKEASASNLEQAELVTQIKELGEVAVNIAKRVPSLAALLV